MPNTKSAKKRVRQNDKQRVINRVKASKLRTALRRFGDAAAQGPEQARQALPAAHKALDQAVNRGVIHRNKADRKKAQLARRAN